MPVGSLVLLALLTQATPAQPQVATPAGSIAGVLISADNGRPVRKAQVRLSSVSPRQSLTTTTDAEGRFTFARVAPAEYTMSASKPGYLESVFGARMPGLGRPGALLTVALGQSLGPLRFPMPRGGVIAGIVTDEFGDPAFNVPIRAMRFVYMNGARTTTIAGTATTDDLGAYRVAGLLPGDYIVSAVPRDTVASLTGTAESLRAFQEKMIQETRAAGTEAALRANMTPPERPSMAGYVPTYYPSAAQPGGAGIVRVGVSETVGAIDLQLQIVRTGTVVGTLVNTAGAPTDGSVQLIDPAMPVGNVGVNFRTAQKDGTFFFAGVVPGTYVLRGHKQEEGPAISRGEASSGMPLTAAMQVTVTEAGTTTVTLPLRRGATVAGRLDLSGLPSDVDLGKAIVRMSPLTTPSDWEMPAPHVAPDAEGRFAFRGVPPARYQFSVAGLPTGWTLGSAMFDQRDAADLFLDVEIGVDHEDGVLKLTSAIGQLNGTVTTGSGDPATDRLVLLFPANRTHWVPQSRRIQVVQPDREGRYVIKTLPAGDYRVALLADLEQGQQFDAGFLSQLLDSSTAISIGVGELKTQNLRVR